MAAPALPPVDVATLGPASPSNPILVDANDPVVAQLSWLPWDPHAAVGGVPRMALEHSEALLAFAVKCKLDRNPAVLAAMAPINTLTLRLSAGAWSRILTAVRDNGLNTRTIAVLDELHSYIRDHVPIVIVATADMLPAPALGVGTNAAQRQLVAQIRYVGLANLASLEINTGALALTAPWTVICKLAGAIGAAGTQAARMVETAPVQAVAEVIRTHGAGGATDAAMAFQLRSNVMRAVLPKVLRAPNVTSGEQCEELADSFVYKASESDRRAIEQKRLDFIAHWYACMRLLP